MTRDTAVLIVKNNIDRFDDRLVCFVAGLILQWIQLEIKEKKNKQIKDMG